MTARVYNVRVGRGSLKKFLNLSFFQVIYGFYICVYFWCFLLDTKISNVSLSPVSKLEVRTIPSI